MSVPTFFTALQDLLFPPRCLGCQGQLATSRPPLLCLDCETTLAFCRSPLCSCCGLPFVSGCDHLCGECLQGHFRFDLARAALHYRPPVSDLILALKFGGNLNGLATMGALVERSGQLAAFAEPDIILPVPLHPSRLRQRGFNQALVLAQACLPFWKKKIAPALLRRHQRTTPQSLLSGQARRTNLRHAFSLVEPALVAGAEVLVVDDVFTTGSTVNACSHVLRTAGARRIEILTLARSI